MALVCGFIARHSAIIVGSSLFALPVAAQPVPSCPLDDVLSEAASEILLDPSPPSPAGLAAAARRAGSDAPTVHALVIDLSAGEAAATVRRERWLRERRGQGDGPLACGAAENDRRRILLATVRGGTLSWRDDGGHVRVSGTLATSFDDPELIFQGADGSLRRRRLDTRELARGISPPDLPRPMMVQLLAIGPAGPRPVAERLVPSSGDGTIASSPPPSEAAAEFAAPIEHRSRVRRAGAGQSDRAIIDDPNMRLAQIRGRLGIPPLRRHRILAEEARQHAGQICASGRVAHVLRPGGDPEQRLHARGITARRVGETVARASSPGAAMAALERSPSHRWTLMEPTFTDVGFGSARDQRGRTCLVVMLAAWPRLGATTAP